MYLSQQKKEQNSRMAEETAEKRAAGGATPDEVALELMKFIAVTTGYGRGTPTTGFGGKGSGSRSSEEYADALLELYERCRTILRKSK